MFPLPLSPRRRRASLLAALCALTLSLCLASPATRAQGDDPPPPSLTLDTQVPAVADEPPRTRVPDDVISQARDAFGRHDRARLASLRDRAVTGRHPLAAWVDYWELANRLGEASSPEVEAFYARWPGSYLEDRLRNDWLLETGRRRDWAAFGRDYPRFRMNDDREVTCYALLADHLAGKEVREAARAAWLAQRDADEGCQLLAQTLFDARLFTDDDVWRRLRQSVELGRPRAARAAAGLLSKSVQTAVNELFDNPARFLQRRGDTTTHRRSELTAMALARMAANDSLVAATQLGERWQKTLGQEHAAWTWAIVAKHAAQSLKLEAFDGVERAWALEKKRKGPGFDKPDWSDDILAWHARAALRLATGAPRWQALLRATDAMSAAERADPTWVYWRARAQAGLAKDGPDGDAARGEARAALSGIASPLTFYGLLAAEELGQPLALPPRPAPALGAERDAVRATPGLRRAVALSALDLRDEARREWNFTLRGMSDRELLVAAQWACELGDWQICINTSERTRAEVDVTQRYAMPYARDITAAAQANGLDPALVFGIIRQETRFMAGLRSHVGASGLMQLMPPTARWVAKKSGTEFKPEQITDVPTNLKLGTFYLKMVLDSFGGSAPLAAAAYNAGPARPRRWRDGPLLEPAVWIENVPFAETRDYVKKVTTNAAVYGALLAGRGPLLKPRLGPVVGPRDQAQPAPPELADLP